jgi:pimeloyl-ACP methyl ester carboxylesterase
MSAKLLSNEYVVRKGSVDLQVYRRRPETTGRVNLPVLFLVHGSSFGALAGYDLQVPGKAGYSMMDVCAGFGFDVWTMDHEGYGRSSKTSSFSDISSGSDDLAVAAKLIERETGIKKAAYYGQSSGSLRAALFAERHPSMSSGSCSTRSCGPAKARARWRNAAKVSSPTWRATGARSRAIRCTRRCCAMTRST